MNPEIFREYDIRGIAGKDITAPEVRLLGQGIGTFMVQNGCRKLTVGRDCRISSDDFAGELIKGTGCHGMPGDGYRHLPDTGALFLNSKPEAGRRGDGDGKP